MKTPSPEAISVQAVDALRPTNVRWRIFLIMLLLTAINYIDRASLSVALPLIAPEFNLSPAMEGLLLSAFFWSYALMQIPGGLLLDRYQTRGIIGVATVAWGLFQALGAASHNWLVLLATRIGLGVAESPIMPAGAKLNGAWLTPNERGRGAVLVDGGAPLGSALGAIIISGLIAWLGSWRMAFVVAGVGTVLAGVLAWKYIRNHPSEHAGVNEAELEHITSANANAQRGRREHNPPLRVLLKDRSILAMFAGYSCVLSVFYGLLTWMPSYLHKAHGLDISAMGGATFLIFMCGFVGELIGGWIGDRWKSAGASPNLVMRSMFSGSALVAAACILGAAYVSSAPLVIGLLCVAMFFIRWCGMYWCLPAIIGGPAKTGVLAGTMNFCGNMAGVVVPILIGLIVEFSGSYFLALIFFVVMAALLALFSSLIDYRERT
ncbi:MFS transporter [Pseudomonas sp. JS3066]|jgi:ACS family D-galactonate transporter-like MFS transporter|uniref:MFS transporter n=1 Tax=unclassified Pseudomonas TaxID=196821 RepID=UPI000EA8E7D8|nr:MULTISPECIES: MFS transporter [unclassified Pseudomonas]AYF86852.1 MFS transporter [Pseudomonas sp. DY-1]MDH4652263.1 MFS transporter [Pseudomonas sp. BN606]MRK21830.1 MFS transporter [Pseudomonas sp. JG-B]WVK95660.1 MFS transporter [Pseudomonas sp. JS3066]